MNKFDHDIKRSAKEEPFQVPDSVHQKIEETLRELPNESVDRHPSSLRKLGQLAACFLFLFLILLPNCSPIYAQTLEEIPILCDFVRIVTIRNYFYSDEHHQMNVKVPEIDSFASTASNFINKDVTELTDLLIQHFEEEVKENNDLAYTSLSVNYEVITNTDSWFTLKIEVFEAAGSSNTYYKYYHIDKQKGAIIQLDDLIAEKTFYSFLTTKIKDQMMAQMKENPDLIFWVEDAPFGEDTVGLDETHNFYWNSQNDLVIPFDKYEIAPGFMGTPEFTIPREQILQYLKPEYR